MELAQQFVEDRPQQPRCRNVIRPELAETALELLQKGSSMRAHKRQQHDREYFVEMRDVKTNARKIAVGNYWALDADDAIKQAINELAELRTLAARVSEHIDVLAMQETKMTDDAFPALTFQSLGYECAHHGQGQWNGVAIVSKVGLENVLPNFAPGVEPDTEARIITATCAGVRISSVYVPNGRELDHLRAKAAQSVDEGGVLGRKECEVRGLPVRGLVLIEDSLAGISHERCAHRNPVQLRN